MCPSTPRNPETHRNQFASGRDPRVSAHQRLLRRRGCWPAEKVRDELLRGCGESDQNSASQMQCCEGLPVDTQILSAAPPPGQMPRKHSRCLPKATVGFRLAGPPYHSPPCWSLDKPRTYSVSTRTLNTIPTPPRSSMDRRSEHAPNMFRKCSKMVASHNSKRPSPEGLVCEPTRTRPKGAGGTG